MDIDISINNTTKLLLIDHRIKDKETIINSTNDNTYCLVFNYYHDTYETILSKIRFLSGNNKYIDDNFYYEEPLLPTQIDSSGAQLLVEKQKLEMDMEALAHELDLTVQESESKDSRLDELSRQLQQINIQLKNINNSSTEGTNCSGCQDIDMSTIQLLPSTLYAEHLAFTMIPSSETSSETAWPFYNESSEFVKSSVFFQRYKKSIVEETIEFEDAGGSIITSTIPNKVKYTPRPPTYINNLDEIYELAKTANEVDEHLIFDTIGVIQHANFIEQGYKLIESDAINSIISNVESIDPQLISWSSYSSFIENLKTKQGLKTLDLMACALYADPNWKYIIDTLSIKHNIKIRASIDNTGSAVDGGNWILETNDINLTNVYFTPGIYSWKYILDTYVDNRFYALRWNNSMYANRAYDSRLKLAGASGTNSFTIETWYYETTKKNNCTIIDMGNYNYTFQIRNLNVANSVGLSLYNSNIGWLYAESAVVPVAQWCHIALTRSGSTYIFYINGVERQRITASSSTLYTNDSTFAIGMQSPDNCYCNLQKDGCALYDLRMWNVARTASQIQNYRNRIIPANTSGLIANYFIGNDGVLNNTIADAITITNPVAMTSYANASNVNKIYKINITGANTADSIWGTDVYTHDSNIAKAAVHAGVILAGETRDIYLRLLEPYAYYNGSSQNGVTSNNYSTSSLLYYGYEFLTVNPIRISSSNTNLSSYAYETNLNKIYIVNITGTATGYIWGDMTYTYDSTIAKAAVHAGFATIGQTLDVYVKYISEQSSFSSVTRNGITSISYGYYPGSYQFISPTSSEVTSSFFSVARLNDRVNGLHNVVKRPTLSRMTNTIPIPNVGFLIKNGYSLTTYNSNKLSPFSNFGDMTYTDFSGVDFSGVNFSGVDLRGSNLTNCNFTNANLTNAILANATTTGANFTGATMTNIIYNNINNVTAVQFDGVDDAVDCGLHSASWLSQMQSAMTAECWFKTSDTANQKTGGILVSRNITGGYANSSSFALYMNPNGQIGFGITTVSSTGMYNLTPSNPTYKDMQWHHVAATYNSVGGVMKIYIDGLLVINVADATKGLISADTTGTYPVRLVIGSDAAAIPTYGGFQTDRQFRGFISDVRLWKVERAAAEILNNYKK